jgi:hypothetical protein
MTLILPRHYARPLGGGGSTPSASSTDFDTTTGGWTSVKTFSGMDIGSAASDRFVVLAMPIYGNSPSFSSVTIGGVSASLIYTYGNSGAGGNEHVFFYGATVPTGTTGDIVLTFSGTVLDGAINVVSTYGMNTTVYDTDGQQSGTALSIDVTNNGVLIAGSVLRSAGAGTFTWSGVHLKILSMLMLEALIVLRRTKTAFLRKAGVLLTLRLAAPQSGKFVQP